METGNPGCEMRGKGKNLTTMVDTHEEHGNPKVGKSTRACSTPHTITHCSKVSTGSLKRWASRPTNIAIACKMVDASRFGLFQYGCSNPKRNTRKMINNN